MNRPADVLMIVSGAFFLGSSRVHLSLLSQCERWPHMRTARRKRTSGIRRLVRKIYVMCIRFFYIGCISIRIATTLGYK
jgi:hypothetical protein